MSRRLIVILAAAVAALAAHVPVARAQEPEPEATPPAYVAFVEGAVTLERDGRPESSVLNMPVLSGDRLRTADGRVEIAFSDGSTLQLDTRTTVDFQSDELIRLIDGRVRVTMAGPARQVSYRIDASMGSVQITQPGDYRVSIVRGETEPKLELAVLRGAADIFTEQGTTAVRAGERAYASAGLAPSYAYAFNSAQWDEFDRWSESRRDQRLGVSTQYLPESMQSYGATLDQYGDWRYAEPYGYVWYPRVAVGWRPYYYGRWAPLPTYGWTWIGVDPFAWPTHHYGRWGFSSGVWFWIPGTRWASAWVSWAYAPGYVSWCPLGWDNRPIFSVGAAFYRGRYSPWSAWTVVPLGRFHGGFVPRHAVVVDQLRARPTFVMRGSPIVRAAVTRAAPIRRVGAPAAPRGIAVPRSGSNSFSTGPQSASPRGPGFPSSTRPSREQTTPNTIRADRGRTGDPGRTAVPDTSHVIAVPRAPQTGAVPGAARRSEFGSAQPGSRADRAPRYEAAPGYARSSPSAVPRTPPYTAAPDYGRAREVPRTSPRYEPSPFYGRPPQNAIPRAAPASPYRGAWPGGAPPQMSAPRTMAPQPFPAPSHEPMMAIPRHEMAPGAAPMNRPSGGAARPDPGPAGMAVPRAAPRSGGRKN